VNRIAATITLALPPIFLASAAHANNGLSIRDLAPETAILVLGADDVRGMIDRLGPTVLGRAWADPAVAQEVGDMKKAFSEVVSESATAAGIDPATVSWPSSFGLAVMAEMDEELGIPSPQYVFFCDWAAEAENATKMLEAYNLGFRGSNIEVQISNAYRLQNNYPEAINWLGKAVEATKAAGGKPETQWFAQALNYATRSKNNEQILHWGKEMIKHDPRPETYHDALFQFQRIADLDNLESLSVLRLARLNKALMFEHEFKQYVEYADARRYPAEVAAVLDEGFAKGTISKNNLTFSEIYGSAQKLIPELSGTWAQDEKAALAAPKGFTAMLTGDALLSFGQYARAKAMYEAALAKGGIIDREGVDQTDRALTNLGIAQTHLKDWAGAKATFAKISGAKRKAIAEYWLIYIDQQTAAPAPAPAA